MAPAYVVTSFGILTVVTFLIDISWWILPSPQP